MPDEQKPEPELIPPENVPQEIRPHYALLVDRALEEIKKGRSDIELRVELQKIRPDAAVEAANIEAEKMITSAIEYAKYVLAATPAAGDVKLEPIIAKLGAVAPPTQSDLFEVLKQLKERERLIRTAGFEAQRSALRESLDEINLTLKAAAENLKIVQAQKAAFAPPSISFSPGAQGQQTISFNPAPIIQFNPNAGASLPAPANADQPLIRENGTPGQEQITISGGSEARRKAVDAKIAQGFVLISARENGDGTATFTFERVSGSSNNNVITAPSAQQQGTEVLAGDLAPGRRFVLDGRQYSVIAVRPGPPGDEVLAFQPESNRELTLSAKQRVRLV